MCHRCDNPPCCNPDHLFLGTSAENSADMTRKGRQARLSGVNATMAKLNADQVLELRAMWDLGSPARVLGERFGVSTMAAWRVAAGVTYQDVPGGARRTQSAPTP